MSETQRVEIRVQSKDEGQTIEIGPMAAVPYCTVMPEEKAEESPVASVSVGVISGFEPVAEVVTLKLKLCDPVLVGVIVSEPR